MKKQYAERTVVVVMFVLVMITFSAAQRATKRLDALYATQAAGQPKAKLAMVKKPVPATNVPPNAAHPTF